MSENMRYSFRYGGERLREHLSDWRDQGKGCRVHADSGLAVTGQVAVYEESGVTEWVLHLENQSRSNSPILSRIYPLDILLPAQTPRCGFPSGYEEDGNGYTDFILHYFHGSEANAHDYEPFHQRLGEHGLRQFVLSACAGRSSNGHMPFFNLQTGAESGVFFAVGWSGQWQALFDVQDDGRLRVRAGMEDAHFHLLPGEQVRTPSIVMMAWAGLLEDSWNQWRRFLRRHKSPELADQPCMPTTWANSWFTFDCGRGVNEANQLAFLDGAADLGLEYMVIDAGWYDCPHPYWWDGVGNWDRPRKDAFPNGFAPIFERAKERGIGFGIWFEFERAAISSQVVKEHPEWVLGATEQHTCMAATVDVNHTSCLLDLGRRDVQDWILDVIDAYAVQGMVWLRHDFNADPLDIWRVVDSSNRRGVTEIRYVEGLYRIYDEIRRRHPGMFVEGCASGGRRIDIETISRNHGYWASDLMCGTPEPMQAHILGFNHILLPHWHHATLRRKNAPLRQGSGQAHTPYMFFSFLGGAPCIGWDTRDESIDSVLTHQWLATFMSMRHLTEGDFYPLTECSLSEQAWSAVQFHRPDIEEGLVAAFRRPASPYETASFPLRALDPEVEYCFTSALGTEAFTKAGTAARRGISITLNDCPDVSILIYRKEQVIEDSHA